MTPCTIVVTLLDGDDEAARRTAADVIRVDPEFRISAYEQKHPYKDTAKLARIIDALRAAGLPE